MTLVRTSPILFALLFVCSAVLAVPSVTPTPPKLASGAWLLEDFNTGRVLAEHNADERMEPASLTKMMTAYVVFAELAEGNINLADQVLISERAWRMEGSRMFVEVDTRVSVEQLLKGVIIQSGNDASVALAEFVAGDEAAFAQLMNQYGARLGLTGTHFVNSTGLPDSEHYSTARDLAALARALIRDFPEQYAWHAIKEFTYNDITQYNRNKLLWQDESVDGLKTGHTKAAGYCLVSSARRDGMRLISVVLGADSTRARTSQTQTLFNFGFRFYETHRLYGALEPITNVRVWKGSTEQLEVGLEQDLYVTVPRGQYKRLNASMNVDTTIVAPVAKGDSRGTVRVTLGDESLAEVPLVALQAVDEGSLWQQVKDHVWLMFE